MKLSGKVALITGASRGIGKSVAEAVAQEGARLFLSATPTERPWGKPSPGSGSLERRRKAVCSTRELH